MRLNRSRIFRNKKWSSIIVFSLVFVSALLIFPAGAIHSSTIIEDTSEYIADIAKKHTINGQYAAMLVEPNDTTEEKIKDSYDEFLYLYGIFREGLATYAETVNAEKSHNVNIKELNNGINYSFFHIDRGYGAEPYKDHFKTLTYPLEVMFDNKHPYDPKASFVYVSQSVADKLLDSEGKEHSQESYQGLIHSYITLEIDGKKVTYYIDNIYYETNYFYDALYEVMGDFIVGGAYYPPGVFKKQAIFFLRNYAYQNQFYINYATSLYPSSDFNYSLLERNLKKGFEIDYNRISFFQKTNYDWLSFLLIAVTIVFLLLSLFAACFCDYTFSIKNHLLTIISLLLPYFVFWIINTISKNIFIFSSFSTICFLWSALTYVILYLAVCTYKCRKDRRQNEPTI